MKNRSMNQPFLPKGHVSTVVVDGRISNIMVNNLSNLGIHIIKTPCCREVYSSIAYHPDILLHPIGGKDVVVAPNVYDELKGILSNEGLRVIRGESVLKRNYPENAAYNIARVSKFAIHNFEYTDRQTLGLLEENEVELIHVKQGYSKCSICIVNEHAIIKSDRGIAKIVEKYGIETLLITPGHIVLPGVEYGFIGGISGLVGKNKLAFSGDLVRHPDHKRILDFLKIHGVEPVFLQKDKPIDLGSIIPLLEMAY